MRLAASNIAWDSGQDKKAYGCLNKYGFTGLEVAPSRVIAVDPYEHTNEAEQFALQLKKEYNLEICSMQSIWFGCQQNMFSSNDERMALLERTYKAVRFAAAMHCKNIVFGCPSQRNMSTADQEEVGKAFFKDVGSYAKSNNVVFALEANPTIYNTNFLNSTEETLSWAIQLSPYGVALNLDIGTMIENKEGLDIIKDKLPYISHIHISEPYLQPINKRSLHMDLAAWLRENSYEGYVSLEMKKPMEFYVWEKAIAYMSEVFGN